jgi:5S rRNA maturation endonuclease (ribonuclease M5)
MRLTNVIIRNFRSFWSEKDEPSAEITLSQGVNYLAGSNNVGKSNLLRAIAFALDPEGTRYDTAVDKPQGLTGATAITLRFEAEPNPPEATKKLLAAVEEYEKTIPGYEEPSLASAGIIHFHVQVIGAIRYARFLTRTSSAPSNAKGVAAKLSRAVEQFHKVVQFVDIRSGEDLESLLKRRFKDMLGNAMGAEHSKEMKRAREAREAYVAALGEVLRPVAKYVEDSLHKYVRDVQKADLVANVPPVEDAIVDARVMIQDAINTPLDQKGTGVRGAMLLLMLSFIAESSKSAVVFCIEEPEAFLHPEAHRALGAGLESFTDRVGVSMLVTTHSPFLFRAEADKGATALFLVSKDANGRSSVARTGSQATRLDLLGSRMLAGLLAQADAVPARAKLVLVVEGWTDKQYLEIAAQRLGIALDAVHIVDAGGAMAAAIQAVTLRGMHDDERLVVTLFDSDDDGLRGQKLLMDKFKGWKKKINVLSYDQWIAPENVAVEAEDLFGEKVMEAFLAEPGYSVFFDEKKRRPSGSWHYGLTQAGKTKFVDWLKEQTSVEMFAAWRAPLEYLLKLIVDGEARAAKNAEQKAKQAAAAPPATASEG